MNENLAPESSLSQILKNAFRYWFYTLRYQLIFSVLYIGLMSLLFIYAGNYYGILPKYLALSEVLQNQGFEAYQSAIQEITKDANYIHFSWVIIAGVVFFYPLNLGLYKMYRKIDLGEKYSFNDLFSGYYGLNFFIYIRYYLFWFFVFIYALPTVFLAILWVLLTLFTAPLMFFMDKRVFETFGLNIKALASFPLEIIFGLLVAFVVKVLGFLSFLGILFVLPFTNAIIYALYSKIFSEIVRK